MKKRILKQLCSGKGVIRVVFATIDIGMGVDIPDIRHVIHVGPPNSVKAYVQETGGAGRDGKPSPAWYITITKTLPRIELACRMICG